MTPEEKVQVIVGVADDMKAEQIETLHVGDRTSIADYFVICSATNDRQLVSIADKAAEKMKELGSRPLRTDGGGTSGWILQDYGDVVFHVMREEQRERYDIETLWKTMSPSQNAG